MYDIHCHLIPSIDDGARNKAEALSLLRIAAEDGITHMVITPHMHLGRFDNFKDDIFDAFIALKLAAANENIPVELAFAAEVRIDADILYLFKQDKIPFLTGEAGSKVILLELPHSQFPPGAEKLINWMIEQGVTPLIAHPERNRDIQKTPDLALKLKRLGCMLQVTAGSVLGKFGEKPEHLAKWLLQEKLADVVASDAHNIKRRPPKLKQAYDLVASEYSSEYANDLFIKNPKIITQNLFIC